MPLTREQKQNILKDLVEKLKKAKSAILVDYTKLPVSKTMELRRSLKQADAEYKVAKKTLISRALKEANYKDFDPEKFKTQVGMVFSYNDPVSAAQSVYKFSRLNEALKILGGFLGIEFKDKSQIMALAQLPPREALLGQVVGTIAAPLSGLVNVLSGNTRDLVNLLNNLRSKKQ